MGCFFCVFFPPQARQPINLTENDSACLGAYLPSALYFLERAALKEPQARAAFVNPMSISGFLLSCVKETQIQGTLKCREPEGFLKLIKNLVPLSGIF